jgi:hypothetical protein
MMPKQTATEESTLDLGNLALVFGYLAIKDLKTLEEKVAVLARLDYKNTDIAKICDTTAASVSVRKAGLNKGKRGKGPKAKPKAKR